MSHLPPGGSKSKGSAVPLELCALGICSSFWLGNATTQKHLGDYQSDDAQLQARMDAGLTYAKAMNLRVGIALTTAEMANTGTGATVLSAGNDIQLSTVSTVRSQDIRWN